DRNRSHWSTSKTPSYTKSVSWQHHPELQLMEANYSQKQKSLTLKMSAKSEANIDRFCELTQSWLPMEKTEKDPVSGVWTVRNSGK
ncbi:GspL/Epsl periplasmic domain-containing protein, partial [Escherichia coli]|uniref:GspL/Epsl periplasmic domain-containing protein n=1 Tax=Escherichia coli TaxID=562 RepID=UPI002B4BB098